MRFLPTGVCRLGAFMALVDRGEHCLDGTKQGTTFIGRTGFVSKGKPMAR